MSFLPADAYHGAYMGPVDISFETDSTGRLAAFIHTERLTLQSCGMDDVKRYADLFGDEDVMSQCGSRTKSQDEIASVIRHVWDRLWSIGSPYSAFPIFEEFTDIFIGHIAVVPALEYGHAELSYCLQKEFHGRRFGTEAVSAVVLRYLPEAIRRNEQNGGEVLSLLTATTQSTNVAAWKILESVGCKRVQGSDGQTCPRLKYQKFFSNPTERYALSGSLVGNRQSLYANGFYSIAR